LSDSMMIKIPAGGLVFVRLSGLKQSLERLPVAAYQNYKLATGVEISCQGDCVIDSDAGILILESSVTPADAFVDAVNWEIIGENYGAQSSGYMDNGLIVKASGVCGGDGTITIRASAMGDPSVYDEITIDISNQESPGGCQVQNAQENEYVVSMYPNPVNDMLNIQASQIIQSVSIRDISGKTLVNKSVNSNELKISMLDYAAGVYIVEINLANHNKILKKLLIN